MATKITKTTKPRQTAAPVMLPHSHCPRCRATWLPRVAQPLKCPRCQAWLSPRPKLSAVA